MIVVGFDVERSGPDLMRHKTIAIGATVLNEQGQMQDQILIKGYLPKTPDFDCTTWNNFWLDRRSLLSELTLPGFAQNSDDHEGAMIYRFQNFRRRWEQFAQEHKQDIVYVCGRPSFDAACLNLMIGQYTDPAVYLDYSMVTQKFRPNSVIGITDMQKGFLLAHDENVCRGFSQRIAQLYCVPKCYFVHNHMPDNDAGFLAYQYWLLQQIQSQKIQKQK